MQSDEWMTPSRFDSIISNGAGEIIDGRLDYPLAICFYLERRNTRNVWCDMISDCFLHTNRDNYIKVLSPLLLKLICFAVDMYSFSSKVSLSGVIRFKYY